MFSTNWESWSHQAIYDALHGGEGARDGFREAGGTWGNLAGRMVAVTDAIGRANTTLGATWKGASSEAAHKAIKPLEPWVENARGLAADVQQAGDAQGERLTVAKDAVRPPTHSTLLQAGVDGFLDGTTLLTATLPPVVGTGVALGTGTDGAIRAMVQQQEEAQAARRTMDDYQRASGSQMASLPPFTGPGVNGVAPVVPAGGGPDGGGSGGGSGVGADGSPGVGGASGAGAGVGGVPGPGAGPAAGGGAAPGAGAVPDAGGADAGGADRTDGGAGVPATPVPPSSTTTAGAAPAPTVPNAPAAGVPGSPGVPTSGVPGGGAAPGGTVIPPVGGVPGAGSGGRLPPGATTGTTPGTGRAGVPGLPGSGAAGRGGGVGGGLGGLPVTRSPGVAVGAGEGAGGGAGGPGSGRGGGAGGLGGPAGLGEGARAGVGGGATVEAAAARAATVAEGRGGGIPMIPPAGMVGGQGADGRHQRPDYLTEDDPDAIAGVLPATAPPVIGE